MTAIGVTTLGSPRAVSRADEDIMADVRAGFPGSWRSLNLGTQGAAGGNFSGVSARLGVAVDTAEGLTATSGSPDGAEADAPLDDTELPAGDEDVQVAERFRAPSHFALRQAEPVEGRRARLTRVVRRIRMPAHAAIAPDPDTSPARANPAAGHRGRVTSPAMMQHAIAQTSPGDRASYMLAILLMVAVWAGVVGIGATFFNTPRSGMKIEWR